MVEVLLRRWDICIYENKVLVDSTCSCFQDLPQMPRLGSPSFVRPRSTPLLFRTWTCINLAVPRFSYCPLALSRTLVHCDTSKMSTDLALSEVHIGQSGRHYRIERILRRETSPMLCVCLAK